jgi:hypothetical protein
MQTDSAEWNTWGNAASMYQSVNKISLSPSPFLPTVVKEMAL